MSEFGHDHDGGFGMHEPGVGTRERIMSIKRLCGLLVR